MWVVFSRCNSKVFLLCNHLHFGHSTVQDADMGRKYTTLVKGCWKEMTRLHCLGRHVCQMCYTSQTLTSFVSWMWSLGTYWLWDMPNNRRRAGKIWVVFNWCEARTSLQSNHLCLHLEGMWHYTRHWYGLENSKYMMTLVHGVFQLPPPTRVTIS